MLQKVAPSSCTDGSRDQICIGDSGKVKCTSCGHEMAATPIIRSGIISHFSEILEVRKSKPDVGKRNKLKVRLDGETLTSDRFVELMEADMAKKESEKEKKKKKKGKKGGKKQEEDNQDVNENICQECGAEYDEDEFQDAWIGCDNDECGRWYHYWCAGFGRKPSSQKKFICNNC